MIRSAALVALLLCLSAPAFAQMSMSGAGPGTNGGAMGGGGGGMSPAGVPARQGDAEDPHPAEDKPVPPPPAIPGAQHDEDAAVAPADKIAAEMSPNDALFDAISRGDLAAAKDALNRGAQLEAHNVLGQTPTVASIDLDRNDITFLLLSMRGATGSTPPATLAAARQEAAHQQASTGKNRRKAVIPASATQSHTPQLSADRGVPNPTVGFIGF